MKKIVGVTDYEAYSQVAPVKFRAYTSPKTIIEALKSNSELVVYYAPDSMTLASNLIGEIVQIGNKCYTITECGVKRVPKIKERLLLDE